MTLNLAFSPCPNDCFIFDAIVHGRIENKAENRELRQPNDGHARDPAERG